MAGTPVDVSTGMTVVFGTSGFSAQLIDAGQSGISRNAIDTSHMGTAAAGANTFGNRTFIPGRLSDPGTFEMEVHFDPDIEPPIDQPAETITVTFPLASGDVTAANWAFSGFVTDISDAYPLDDKMVQTLTVKISGNVTLTAASAV
jgi:hypothetical protein